MSEGKPNTVEKDPCEAALANEVKDSSETKALGKEDTSLASPIELETLLFGKKTKDPDMSLDSLDPDYDVSEAVSSEEQASDGSVDASDSDGSEDHGTVKMPERKQNTVEKDPCEEKHNSVVESKAVLAKEEKDSEANAALVKALESTIEPETPLCGKNRKDPHMSLDSLDPIAEAVSSDNGSVDANDDTSASDGSEDDAIAHEFWEMQPVWKFRDLFEKNLREGPIEVATLLSEVKQEPHELPRGYEWNTLDMTSTGMFGELCRFLRDNYTDYEEGAAFNYTDASDSDGSEDHGTVKMPERKQNTVEKDPCEEKHNSVVESKAALAKEEKDSEANAELVKEDTSLDPVAEAVSSDNGSVDANDGTSASDGSEDDALAHEFWETQPIWQFRDLFEKNLREGPIEVATLLSEVKQEPHELPTPYEWITVDINSTDMCAEVFSLLEHNYTDYKRSGAFNYLYSMDFLKWALTPPGYYQSWHVGLRDKTSKELVAFISGVPGRISVRGVVYKMAKINFLCILKEHRSQRLAPVIITELTRRIHLENIWQAAYFSDEVLPTPISTCRYWARILNPEKLIQLRFTTIDDFMRTFDQLTDASERSAGLNPKVDTQRDAGFRTFDDIRRAITEFTFYKDAAPVTPGFRKMERRDVPAVTRLLRNYLSQFAVSADFEEEDVEHWLLPREAVVASYVVEQTESKTISDLCSFYQVPLMKGNNRANKLECAYSFYNVATKTPFVQLINDALIMSKQKGLDLFYALDAMQNEEFFRELKFGEGYGELNYYLYNYRLTRAFKPSEVGFVLI